MSRTNESDRSTLEYAPPDRRAASRAARWYYGNSAQLSVSAILLFSVGLYLFMRWQLPSQLLLVASALISAIALGFAAYGLRRGVPPRVVGVLCLLLSAFGLLLFLGWCLFVLRGE